MRCPQCKYINPPGAHFCCQCGAELDEFVSPGFAQTTLIEQRALPTTTLPGERKLVTILFTDIVSSTAIAEKLDPEEWKEIVSGAHRIVGAAVRRYEGTIAQYLGDGALVFFGAPITHEDDPQRAVRATLEILSAISDYRLQLAGLVDDFQMRIGIHTGTVVVGQVGDDRHMEYLAVGDAVNLAARLQSAASPGRILVSETVARQVRATFDLVDLGEITVKGKNKPVHVYEILQPIEGLRSGHGIPGLTSRLVAREAELRTLKTTLKRLDQGDGGIVFVLGEAGIGKSRLLEEARCEASVKIRWLEGRSLSYGATLSYWAITQLILQDLKLTESDPEPRVRVALNRRLEALFGERGIDFAPYLQRLLGLRLETETVEKLALLGAETLKRQLLVVITAYFSALAECSPIVLVFEDLHWADASTLEVLERLFSVAERLPLLLVCLARHERGHGSWRLKQDAEVDFPGCFTEIILKQLSVSESENLMSELLESTSLPDEIRRQILVLADGNPLYIEEILSSLIDHKALVGGDAGWEVTQGIGQIEIPSTLQGVLLARIDCLAEDVRQTLQLASVIGRSFLYRILQAISEEEVDLVWHLAQLQRADLVREKARLPELEYTFKHSLTQEAAYSSLLFEQRREFHRRVARTLENLFKGREAEFAGLLAHHYDAAGDREKAIGYLLLAGDKARLEYASEEAKQDYLRLTYLLGELGDLERLSRTWLKLGLVHQSGFEFEQAQQAYEKAFAMQRQAGPQEKLAACQVASGQERILRWGERPFELETLDPGNCSSYQEYEIVSSLFAGLTAYDPETNIVPHAARSWEALDGGLRYIFHLRDDISWTDGNPVTAADFEWAWKRNLAPGGLDYPANLLDVVLGARSYRLGEHQNPDSVGVHALDPLTLEVRLEIPASYFIYLTASQATFPLPVHIVERYGSDWWKPPHGIYNGFFRLVEFSSTCVRLERNPGYFGDFPGNLDGVEKHLFEVGDKEMLRQFLNNELDLCTHVSPEDLSVPVSDELWHHRFGLETVGIVTNPGLPPLNDRRVRQAIAHGLDFKSILDSFKIIGGARRSGGVVPPGMIGHSPELGLPYNLPLARQFLAEAGFPGGKGFPVLKLGIPLKYAGIDEMVRQLEDNLGIHCDVQLLPVSSLLAPISSELNLIIFSWIADYPDPDNFLNASLFITFVRNAGWRNPHYDTLIAEATKSRSQSHRLELYREADRILTNDEVIIIPFMHGLFGLDLIHPWVSGCENNALNLVNYKYIRLERAA